MKTKRNTSFVKQAMFLSVSGVIVRIIGLLYGIVLTNTIGDLGNGYYSSAYNIYSIVLMICSYSIPMAISKIMSEKAAMGEHRIAHRVFQCSLIYVVIVGGIASLLIFFFAPYIVDVKESALAMRILAPTIFFSGILSAFRGFFQAQKSVVPTAVSQLIEQIFNAFFSVGSAYFLTKIYLDHASEKVTAEYGAAGGAVGTGFGVLAGLLFLLFVYVVYKPVYRKRLSSGKQTSITYKETFRIIFLIISPVIISTCIYNICTVVDMKFFYGILEWKDMDTNTIAKLYGIFSRKFFPLANLPIALASSMVAAVVPQISMSKALNDHPAIHHKIHNAVQYSMLFIIPCAFGLAVLADPIITFLFPNSDNTTYYLLLFGIVYIIFTGLSTVFNGVLQGLGRVDVPMKNAAISLIIHIVVLLPLLIFTELNIYAVLIAISIYALCITFLNYRAIKKTSNYIQERKKTFVIPILASGIMSIVVFVVNRIMSYLLANAGKNDRILAGGILFVTIPLAAVIYFAIVLKFCFDKEQMKRIPFISKFIR